MSKQQHNKTLIWVILIGCLWVKCASLLSMPFLTLFLLKNNNLAITNIGIIVGLQPLALCFGSVIGGHLSDIFRKTTILLLSIIISSIVYLSFYLASKYLTLSYQAIAFGLLNLINGICQALFSPVSRALVSDLATDSQENIKFLHMRYLSINLGAAIGPLIGAYAGIAASNLAFLITGVLYLIYALVVFVILREKGTVYASNKPIYRNKGEFILSLKYLLSNHLFMVLLSSLIVFNIIYVQLSSNLSIIISKSIVNGTLFFSQMLSLNAIMVICLQPIIYLIVRKHTQRLLILYGYLIILAGSMSLVFIELNKFSIISFVICLTIAEILVFPTGSILVSELVPKDYLGIAFGAIDFEYFGSAIGPMLGGMITQHFAIRGFCISLLIFSFLSIVIYLPCLWRKPVLNVKNVADLVELNE